MFRDDIFDKGFQLIRDPSAYLNKALRNVPESYPNLYESLRVTLSSGIDVSISNTQNLMQKLPLCQMLTHITQRPHCDVRGGNRCLPLKVMLQGETVQAEV